MSAVYLYDDARARAFQPFALTRPAGELRAGALLVRERWTCALGAAVSGHLTAEHLRGFHEPGAAPVSDERTIAAGSWIANARFAPALALVQGSEETRRLVSDGQVAAVRLGAPIDASRLADGTLALSSLALPSLGGDEDGAVDVEGWWLHDVWDLVRHLVPMLNADVPVIGRGPRMTEEALPPHVVRLGGHPVYVEQGAVVEPMACFDTTAGPIVLRAGSHVQAFTRLVGPMYVGEGSTVTADRIEASSIGDTCKVHGELSNAILIGHANKGHAGFVGHSIFGRWVNLGAGTTTSNLKNTYGPVQLWTPEGVRETGMQFLGTLFGDHAKTGIGLHLTTGTVLGAGANVFGTAMPPKVVAPFSWGEAGALSTYRVDKFLEVAARVMARRHVELREEAAAQLRAAHDARWSVEG
jgi:UDP-N-acetylglucosamine diphosphorylase / glucose-1-phosphate thymidylyltransferase / UDP-N-acetylgalactosamine diphosphorylase / glucosamine-1-phosphate N-acetyltransferase / galactosamine-1-phosphate N-acetyltransferase